MVSRPGHTTSAGVSQSSRHQSRPRNATTRVSQPRQRQQLRPEHGNTGVDVMSQPSHAAAIGGGVDLADVRVGPYPTASSGLAQSRLRSRQQLRPEHSGTGVDPDGRPGHDAAAGSRLANPRRHRSRPRRSTRPCRGTRWRRSQPGCSHAQFGLPHQQLRPGWRHSS